MKIHQIKLTSAVLSLALFIAVDASAQRRGVNGGGFGAPQGGSQGMGMIRPQPNVGPPRGADNTAQGFGGPRRGGSNVAPNQQGGSFSGRQPNMGAPRPGTDINIARGRGAFSMPSTRRLSGSNQVYRVWEGLPYGRNYISVRPQGVYYNNNGFYTSYYVPRIGLSVSVLPYGYYPFYYGPSLYYYGGGMFYQQTDNTYTVVEPPMGAEVKQLPDNAQSIVINGVQYYELNGVYYQPITKDDGSLSYQVAGKDGVLNTDDANVQDAPPIQAGDLVDNLPEDYRKISLNGEKYYVTPSGYYLQDAVDENGKKVYKIISVPEPDANDAKK